MNNFIIQTLNLHHQFYKQSRLLLLDSLPLIKKINSKKNISFEQFLIDHFLVPKIEYVTPQQLQRALQAKALIDLQDITNKLMQSQIVTQMKTYKSFYQKYPITDPLINLWFLWTQLKNKQLKQKPFDQMIQFYETQIIPELTQLTHLKLKFQIYYAYQLHLYQDYQKSAHQLIQLRHDFAQLYNLKAFVTDFHFMKFDSSHVQLKESTLNQIKTLTQMPIEDFFSYIYLQIKLLYPISKQIAPSLAEDIYNEMQVLLVAARILYKTNDQINLKFTQLNTLLEKYYDKIGINLFKRRIFTFQNKKTHTKNARSLINITNEETTQLQIPNKMANYSSMLSSLYDPIIIQQIQGDLTRSKPATTTHSKKQSMHTRGQSLKSDVGPRQQSQFQFPEQFLNKDLVLEVDNYQMRNFQKRKPVQKISVAQVYQNLISSVPMTKQNSFLDKQGQNPLSSNSRTTPQQVATQPPSIHISGLNSPKSNKSIVKTFPSQPIEQKQIKIFSLSTILIALNMRIYHLENPGSKKFAKLIAKHILAILRYVDEPPYVTKQTLPISRAHQIQQLIRKGKKKDAIEPQQPRNLFFTKPSIGLKAKFTQQIINFSPGVKQTIRKIRALIKMGFFRKRKAIKEKQGTILGAVAPKQHSLQNYLDFSRFKTVPDNHRSSAEEKQFQSVPTPREHKEKKEGQTSFAFFKTLALAKRLNVQFMNKDEVHYLQEKYGTLQQVKRQHFYYPSIKYLILENGKLESWKIKYRDLTSDKNFMVIHALSDETSKNFYRFDLPVIRKGKEKQGITIWPTVEEALQEFDDHNKYSNVFGYNLNNSIVVRQPSFIVGLTQRAKAKVCNQDITSCGYVQAYFYNFHRSQIVKIKKIKGQSFDILPIIKGKTCQYIDMVKVKAAISKYHQINLINKKIDLLEYIRDKLYSREVFQYDYELINNILLFRFMCSCRDFMIKGFQELNLQGCYIRLYANVIRIKNDVYSQEFLQYFNNHLLLTFQIKFIQDVNYNCGGLLNNVQKTKIPNIFNNNSIDKRYFEFEVSAITFNKEKKSEGKEKMIVKPLSFSIQLYHQLLSVMNLNDNVHEQLKFDQLLRQTIFEIDLTQNQKMIFSDFLKDYFEINLKEMKVSLKQDYNYLKQKKMSMKFLKQQETQVQLYAISPIEKQLMTKFTNIVNEKEIYLQNMFKLEQNQGLPIQEYENIYQGKQTIEEPDFMNNNQELLTAINQIKQIPLFKITNIPKSLKIRIQNNNLSYQINKFLQPFKQAKIYNKQSYYVNHPQVSSILMKTMILNKSKELLNYFNCNNYQFIYSRATTYFVQVYMYYTFNRRMELQNESHKLNYRIYYFDGDQLYMNISINSLKSKTQAIKMIFSYSDLQELFRINMNQFNNLYYFDDKFVIGLTEIILNNTYAERKFLYALPTFLNRTFMQFKHYRQKFINYHKSISIQSDSPRSPQNGNLVQVNDLNLLERHNNCKFVVLFYDAKEQVSKYYCETYLKDMRVIGHYIKKFNVSIINGKLQSLKNGNCEYTIITVYQHLILDVWIIQIYVPKTSRYLQGSINILDLAELENHDMFTSLIHQFKQQQSKSRFIRKAATQNKYVLSRHQRFANLTKFFEFSRQISNNQNKKLITQKLFSSKYDKKLLLEQQIWQNIINLLKLNKKAPFDVRLESEVQNRSYIEKSLIEQLEHDTNANSKSYKIIGTSQIQKTKNASVENQEQLLHFKKLAGLYLQFLKEQQIIMIRSTQPNSSQICVNLGFTANVREFIHKIQLKIDKIGLYSITFFLDYSDEEVNQDNPFLAFESITYSNSSSFNLTIRIFGFQPDQPIYYANQQVNVREVLNLFIADGYFKYQTNYMNAKLSLSDLKQICEYVGFKIKTSNFLGLANQQKYYNTHPIFLEDKQNYSDIDGYIYSGYKKGYFIQLQLFTAHAKVHINKMKTVKLITFSQQKLYFNQIDEICPYFSNLITSGLYKQALSRLLQSI